MMRNRCKTQDFIKAANLPHHLPKNNYYFLVGREAHLHLPQNGSKVVEKRNIWSDGNSIRIYYAALLLIRYAGLNKANCSIWLIYCLIDWMNDWLSNCLMFHLELRDPNPTKHAPIKSSVKLHEFEKMRWIELFRIHKCNIIYSVQRLSYHLPKCKICIIF